MPELIRPVTRVQRSYLRAIEEFRLEGRLGPEDHSAFAREARDVPPLDDERRFARYVDDLIDQSREDAPRREGCVPSTLLWYVEDDEWIGRLSIRHRLTPQLLTTGGHIGYDVRPSIRRRGHATAMLGAALPVARELGISSALLTYSADNVASRTVIEANGGVVEDERDGKLRYWIGPDVVSRT